MPSAVKRGNYYKKRTQEMYEKMGYVVQLTEFTKTILIPGRRPIFTKVDVFGADGIAMNGKEIIFWNSKHWTSDHSTDRTKMIKLGKEEFAKFPFPPSVKKQLVMWEPRKSPTVIEI